MNAMAKQNAKIVVSHRLRRATLQALTSIEHLQEIITDYGSLYNI
jgi:hypothetical protein